MIGRGGDWPVALTIFGQNNHFLLFFIDKIIKIWYKTSFSVRAQWAV